MKASVLIVTATTAFMGFGTVAMAQTTAPSTPQTTMPSTPSTTPRMKEKHAATKARPMYYGHNVRHARRHYRRWH
jgi:hypothetical protein